MGEPVYINLYASMSENHYLGKVTIQTEILDIEKVSEKRTSSKLADLLANEMVSRGLC